MSELDVTIDLKQIQAPSLTSVEYGKNIKEQFENINSNFRRVANADFVSGKKGSSIYYDNLPLMIFNNDGYDFTGLGKRMIEDITNVSINWDSNDISCDWDYTRHDFTDDFYNRNLNLKYVTYQDYENVTHSITFYDYIKTNINITVLYTLKDTEDVTGNTIDDDHNRDYICSPQIYTFLDQRYANTEEQGGINSARFEDREDVSCLLILNYINILDSDDTVVEQGIAQFKRSNLFPTLYYDSNDSVFKWKLYGQETGIRANGPKGDSGAVGTVWIVRLEDAENTDQLTPNTPNPILQEINGVAITSVAVINDDSSWSWVSIDDVDPKPLSGDTCIALKLYSDTDNSDDSSLNEAFVSPIFVQGNTYYVSTNKANAINQNISLTNFRNWLRNNIGGIFIHYNDETSPTTVTGAHYLYDKKHLNRHALYITPKVRDGGLNLDNPDTNDYDPNTELNIKYGQVQVKSDNIYLESSYSNQSSVPARYVSSNITVENDSISLETYNSVGTTSDNVSINLHSTGGSDDVGVYIDGATKINGPTKVLDNLRVDGIATSNVNGQPGVTLGCPIGTIVMWPGNKVPEGWLLCNGSPIGVELTSNPDNTLTVKYYDSFKSVGGRTFTENNYKSLQYLANVIHGKFGTVSAGNGLIRAVNLPNLQKRFPLGSFEDGTIGKNNGNSGNGWNTSLGKTGGEDTHKLFASESGLPAHTHNFNTSLGKYNTSGSLSDSYNNTKGSADSKLLIEFNNTQDAQNPHNNIPPFLALNFIIKYM